jgi:4a-hydroxytetrahydrobiopterin dehydratase
MTEPITARQFHFSSGVEDWRVADGGAAPAPDGLSSRDVELARRISTAAHQLGLTAEPSEVQNVVVTIDALDIAKVLPFWRAVLGYGDRHGGPVEELNDRHRRKPVVGFQQMDAPRPQRNRVHLDIWVPHDQAEARVAAAVAAGGRVVSDEMAPSGWVLADPEGNEACVATWIGTDGRGYP